MSEVTTSFMFRVLGRLAASGQFGPRDGILVVGAGKFDRAVLGALGCPRVTFTNLAPATPDAERQNAVALDYPDNHFDHVLAHATLHHMDRPHQAVCEMYRVARRTVLFFESQDSWLLRLGVRFGLTVDYEVNAIHDQGGHGGGVNATPVPNYVYRWTPREVEKLVRSLDAAREPELRFFREWDFTWPRVARRLAGTPLGRLPAPLLAPLFGAAVGAANALAGRHGNRFAACIFKDRARLHPWIAEQDGGLRLAR